MFCKQDRHTAVGLLYNLLQLNLNKETTKLILCHVCHLLRNAIDLFSTDFLLGHAVRPSFLCDYSYY